ncbi:MAG: serine protease [Gemmataceae bacterium]|nr:serine protease [Gemmataceae bacterium]
MKTRMVWLAGVLLLAAGFSRADESFAKVAAEVNPKLVKVYGSGGFKGLPSYGTGVLVSPDGYILTVASHLLETPDLRVHLHDGSRWSAKLIAVEPELDAALIKIGTEKNKVEDLPFFDMAAAKAPLAQPGTGILAFSNQFHIATRDEPMSVMRGTIAAYARLHGRIGIFEAPYTGMVYVVDAITNNPGAAGGIVTNRKGEILGLIGKELRNEQTNTWINYAVPLGASLDIRLADGTTAKISLADLVEKKEKYKAVAKVGKGAGGGGYLGLLLVPNVVERTPPYIESVEPGSPAAKAGLQPDDLVVYVDGLPVVSIDMLWEMLGKYRPQDRVQLEIRRGDKLQTVSLTFEVPPRPVAPSPPPSPTALPKGNQP